MNTPRARITIILCFVVVCLLSVFPYTAISQTAEPAAVVLVAKLNVRAGPGASHAIVGSAVAGDSLAVLGQHNSCAWLRIHTAVGIDGWVSGDPRYVRLAIPCAEIPVAPADASAPSIAGTLLAVCPFFVYDSGVSDKNHYYPAGWMGDHSSIKIDINFQRDLDTKRKSVLQITYSGKATGGNKWAGIYWWDPAASNFGAVDGGYDLRCATKLRFMARGEKGGEVAEFKAGGMGSTYYDSFGPISSGPLTLTKAWREYTIPLGGEDLSHVIGGFVWVVEQARNPNGATIYLDDIVYTK